MRTDGTFARPVIWLLLIFFATIRVPMTAYLYLGHPAWSTHYFLEPGDIPVYALAGVILAGAVAMLFTWFVGALFMHMEKRVLAALSVALTGLGLLAGLFLLTARLRTYGSYDAYHQQLTLGIMDVKLGYVLIVWLVGTVAAASFVCLEMRRDARRARAV